MNYFDRVVVLVDMDCFYCQVEEKLDAKLTGKPIAVVQYNAWRGGGIIAVNYPAREKGVKRGMRGDEAKQKCPDIILARVPQVRGKADLTKYREAGKRVADVLQKFTSLLERASVDEAYLDITEEVNNRLKDNSDIDCDKLPNSFVVGYDNVEDFVGRLKNEYGYEASSLKLAIGGVVAEEIRAEVLKQTGYKCSAGIAHNKILAKLVCGLHKPNKQTILPQTSLQELYKDLSVKKIKSLGGKFGELLTEKLKISYMGELSQFTERELVKKFDEKSAKWLYNIARGIDTEPVTSRLTSKSIGCCKRFPGKSKLKTQEDVEHWTEELAGEIAERLEKDMEENCRKAKQMVVSFASDGVNSSRTHPLNSYETKSITRVALEVLKKFCLKNDASYNLTYLGISVGNFQSMKNRQEITSFFKNMQGKEGRRSSEKNNLDDDGSLNDDDNQKEITFFKNMEEIERKENNNLYSSDAHLDVSNCSVYSADTEDLNEDPRNLICLEDVASESDLIRPIYADEQEKKPTLNSFFMNFFSKNNDNTTLTKPETKNEKTQEQPTMESSPELVATETCPECNRNIPISEIISHTDYHYALKMSKEESLSNLPNTTTLKKDTKETPKQSKKSNKSPKQNGVKKIQKRKHKSESNHQILTFFQKDSGLNETNSEVCEECNKRIKFEDVASHADYHMAKKLHSELNSTVKVVHNDATNKGKDNKNNKKNSSDLNVKPLTSFFKTA